MPTWEREAYGRSVEWAQYFETIIEQIPTQEEELFLNKKLQEELVRNFHLILVFS